MHISKTICFYLALPLCVLISRSTPAFAQPISFATSLVSRSTGGESGVGASETSGRAISSDGNRVVFTSSASNLVGSDTNGTIDVFLRQLGASPATTLVSKATDGTKSNGDCYDAMITANGRFVAFGCKGNSLVTPAPSDAAKVNIYLRDLSLGTTIRVSLGNGGLEPNGHCFYPAVSEDGRYVVMRCSAPNLAAGLSWTNDGVYLRDTVAGTLTLISRTTGGTPAAGFNGAPDISADGRYIVFSSDGGSLVAAPAGNGEAHVYLYDRVAQTMTLLDQRAGAMGDGSSGSPHISADGRYVTFDSYASNLIVGDVNGYSDVFLYDRNTGSITMQSVSSAGAVGDFSSYTSTISADGRYLAFFSEATTLTADVLHSTRDVFLRDLQTHLTFQVSAPPQGVAGTIDNMYQSVSNGAATVFQYGVRNNAPNQYDVMYAVPDFCPNDAGKIAPGVCGCGVPDADTDGDGTLDCEDSCPNDSAKVAVGLCGCGAADTDSDSDGTPNCIDACPNDAAKTAAGVCGCGTADTDLDQDGTHDCHDGCPNDPAKLAAGVCGCGGADADSDNDGTFNCNDGCPNDATKAAAGVCGCGTADTDGDQDGTPNCNDACPNDAAKTAAGACGCGISDADQNHNNAADCLDPSAALVPANPAFVGKKGSALITMQRFPGTGINYTVTVTLKKFKKSFKFKSYTGTLKKLAAGSYSGSYKVTMGSLTTKASRTVKFKVK